MMKLKTLMPVVTERFSRLKDVRKYAEELKTSGNFKDFEVRLSWDLLRAVFRTSEICEWYDKYDCHDSHITALAKTSMREVFGNELKDLI